MIAWEAIRHGLLKSIPESFIFAMSFVQGGSGFNGRVLPASLVRPSQPAMLYTLEPRQNTINIENHVLLVPLVTGPIFILAGLYC